MSIDIQMGDTTDTLGAIFTKRREGMRRVHGQILLVERRERRWLRRGSGGRN
jgi:hypothetical protein